MELWGWLRADLLDDENGLPEKLRAGLVSLSYTVDRQTRAVLQGMAGVGLLVEINRAVMQGLQGNAAARHGGGRCRLSSVSSPLSGWSSMAASCRTRTAATR
ncbi:flagellar biosynthesis regulator FlaF [Azospirillum doebereinerae]|uniref:flagellar biosynthesis regulator FlaF n=1 Tax=Azospirillum doebereinerae TaxID=92933 RepID=UPI00384B69F1